MKILFATRLLMDVIGRGVAFAIIIVLSRILGVEEFGKLAFGLSVVNISYLLCDIGVSQMFLKQMGESFFDPNPTKQPENVWREFWSLKLVLSGLVFLGAAILAPWIWKWPHPSILLILFIYMIGNMTVDFLNQLCNASHRLGVSGVLLVMHKGAVVVALGAALLSPLTLISASWHLGLGSFIGSVLCVGIIKWKFGFSLSLKWDAPGWMKTIKSSSLWAIIGILFHTNLRMGLILLPWWISGREVGLFGAAHKIFETGYMVPASIMAISMPKLASLFLGSGDQFKTLVKKVFMLFICIFFCMITAGELVAPMGMKILFGAAYLPGIPLLRILILAGALGAINVFLMYLLFVIDLMKENVFNIGVSTVFCLIVSTVFIKQWGGFGAAWAAVATEFFFGILMYWTLLKKRKWGLLLG